MIPFVLTARSRGEETAYLPLESQGIQAKMQCMQGDGSADDPWQIRVTLHNPRSEAWQGVIQLSMPVEADDPRFYLPGFMYGTNRGDAPLVVDSPCPRLRMEDTFPASPWWMTRSDRLSHPAAFIYGGGRLRGFMAPAYFVVREGRKEAWQPGVKEPFCQYGGFGCSLAQRSVSYTLGYENAPWFFLESHVHRDRAPMGENCFVLEAGETVTFHLYQFDIPAMDERALHGPLRWVYAHCHEKPRRASSLQKTVADIAGAISRDAWLPEWHAYSGFVFDRGDHLEYNPLPSIAWTNGLAAAVPVLQSACRLGDAAMRRQAVECVEHIVRHSINERSGLPYMAESEAGWSNHGWWFDRLGTPGHAAYLVGQAVYLILKAYDWEKRFYDTEHSKWLTFAEQVIRRTEKTRNSDGEYPYVLSEKTGAGLEYDSFSGVWCMAAAAYYSYLTGDITYLPGMMESERHYHSQYICHQECYGGPLDIDKAIDSEGILAYIRAVRYLHEITGESYLLEHMKDALEYEFTFKFCYNSPIKVPPLSTVGWSSCGGSITSVTNPHVHPMSSSVIDEMIYYTRRVKDAYISSRLRDTILWSCQMHNTYDGEFGYGKKGWMSERFCHCEGLVKERYPDGTLASTWFALMPWAAGCILEGLAGDAWNMTL